MDQYVLLEVLGSFNFFAKLMQKFCFEDLITFISSALAFCNLTRSTINLPLALQFLTLSFKKTVRALRVNETKRISRKAFIVNLFALGSET